VLSGNASRHPRSPRDAPEMSDLEFFLRACGRPARGRPARFVDGLSLGEIAAEMDIALARSKSRLHNALESLRQDERT